MSFERNGLVVAERRDDFPSRCACCPSNPKRLVVEPTHPECAPRRKCPATNLIYFALTPRGGIILAGFAR
jgi:hypothetical protein